MCRAAHGWFRTQAATHQPSTSVMLSIQWSQLSTSTCCSCKGVKSPPNLSGSFQNLPSKQVVTTVVLEQWKPYKPLSMWVHSVQFQFRFTRFYHSWQVVCYGLVFNTGKELQSNYNMLLLCCNWSIAVLIYIQNLSYAANWTTVATCMQIIHFQCGYSNCL